MKGFVKTLEAGLATVFILVFVLFFFSYQPKTETQTLDNGYNCLKYLDQKGILRYYSENNLEYSLSNDIKDCLPPLLNYKVRICKIPECTIQLPENKEVLLSRYIISGENSVEPTLINLWVWLK